MIPFKPPGNTWTGLGYTWEHLVNQAVSHLQQSRTLIFSSASHLVSAVANLTPSARFSGNWNDPKTRLTFFRLVSSSLTNFSATIARVPPGAKRSYAVCCVSAREQASNMYEIGVLTMLATCSFSAAAESVRSRTCVAPNDVSKPLFFNDAVVIIGLKPDSLASWIPAPHETRQHAGE